MSFKTALNRPTPQLKRMSWHLRLVAGLAFALPPALAIELVDCYYYDGSIAANNTVCPNSQTCCNADATCTENRLCHNVGQALLIRGPCAVSPWNSTTCSDVCLYDETNGRFPRVHQCGDGSWCCDNDEACCNNGNGVWLTEEGDEVNSANETTTSSTMSSTSSTSSSTSTISTTSSATLPAVAAATETGTSTPQSTPDPGMSTGTKAGLGVGVALGVLLLAAIGIIIWLMRKRKANRAAAQLLTVPAYQDDTSNHAEPKYAQSAFSQPVYSPVPQYGSAAQYTDFKARQSPGVVQEPPKEAMGSIPGQAHHDAGRHEVHGSEPLQPQELEGSGFGHRQD